jgi:hypothetical protein
MWRVVLLTFLLLNRDERLDWKKTGHHLSDKFQTILRVCWSLPNRTAVVYTSSTLERGLKMYLLGVSCRLNNYRVGLTAILTKHVFLISVLFSQLYLNKLISLIFCQYCNKNKIRVLTKGVRTIQIEICTGFSLLLAVLYSRFPNFVKLDLRDFNLS